MKELVMITFSGVWRFKKQEHRQAAVSTAKDKFNKQDGFFPAIASADCRDGFYLQTGTKSENNLLNETAEILGGGHHNETLSTLDQSIKKDLDGQGIIEGKDYKHYPKQHLHNTSMGLRRLFSFLLGI